MSIKEAWHLFQIRRTILTSNMLCVAPAGVINGDIRFPELTQATASILYLNLLGLLEEAIASQMSETDFERCVNLKNRLEWLNKRGQLIDWANLDALRERRNEVAHESNKAATVDELNTACSVVEDQLVAWGLIQPGPKYELAFERSALRNASTPELLFEQDRILRVVRGDRVVAEVKQTAKLHRD